MLCLLLCTSASLSTATLAFRTWSQLQVETSDTRKIISSEEPNGKLVLHWLAWSEYAFQLPCVWHLKSSYHHSEVGITLLLLVWFKHCVSSNCEASCCSVNTLRNPLCNSISMLNKRRHCFTTWILQVAQIIHCARSPYQYVSMPISNG